MEIDTLLAAGFKLRFYRIEDNLTVNLSDIKQRIDGDVSALYIIHYFGFPQPLIPIQKICNENNLKLIEDCALSLFSRDDRGWLGSYGDLAIFSVFKTIPIPHGGFLVTKEERATGKLKRAPFMSTLVQTADLFHQNIRTSGWGHLEHWIIRVSRSIRKSIGWDRKQTILSGSGWDPRLLKYNASLWVLHMMRSMDPQDVIAKRRQNFEHLASRLRGYISTPFTELPLRVCPLFFPAMVQDKIEFQKGLTNLGIESGNYWYVPHPACPPDLAQEVSGWRNHLLELPIHQGLTHGDIDRIADAVLRLLGKSQNSYYGQPDDN
jgi:dTDP-4-amino-4,6-dideoxygalactose transaminase